MGRVRKTLTILMLAVAVLVLLWWAFGRITSGSRRVTLHHLPETSVIGEASFQPSEVAAIPDSSSRVWETSPDTGSTFHLRLLAWNIAHGRGDVRQGWVNNWKGGTREERISRLMRISHFIHQVDADVVVLNEVDFSAEWSGGLNQAEIVARIDGYPWWVEHRNYDLHLPLHSYTFGNALLSRVPILTAEWIEIPPHSLVEAVILGAKSSSLVTLETGEGPLSVIPVHLEVRSRETRLSAAPVFDSVGRAEPHPVILAGDFNSSPSGWPGAHAGTLLDSILSLGWTSPRALGNPEPGELTFPTPNLQDARDWILVEPPLRVVEARVLHEAQDLSDHAPVLATIALFPSDSIPDS